MKAYLKSLIIASLALLTPIKPAIIAALVLTVADLILGVVAAMKRKEVISSQGFRRTVAKLFVYESAIILGFLTETYLTGDLAPITKIVSAFVGITELKSIMENLGDINGSPILLTLLNQLAASHDYKQGNPPKDE